MFNNYRNTFFLIFAIIVIQSIYHIFIVQLKRQEEYTRNLQKKKFNTVDEPVSSDRTSLFTTNEKNNIVSESLANISLFERFRFSIPNPTKYSDLPLCDSLTVNHVTNQSWKYRVNVSRIVYSYEDLEKKHGFDIHLGGHWYPSHCQPKQRLALVICYREREQQLKIFLDNIHPFLKQQQLDYTILIVNQHGKELFNRGALFNVGYIEAMKLYPFTCFIFHDVDLLPEDSRNLYTCDYHPRHMSVAVDKFNYKLLYATLFGGVTAFDVDDFVKANGFPNIYWGWGNEDDDMYLRVVKQLKKNITRYPAEIARYQMVRSHGHKSGPKNPKRDELLFSKYDYHLDGINTIQYKMHHIVLHRLYTLINVTLFEESYEQICKRLNIKIKEKKT